MSPITDAPVKDLAFSPDDLKHIRGIGPAIERQLNQSGIETYYQLAEQTPDQLALILKDFKGMSAANIHQKDWIGQARQQASNHIPTPTEKDARLPGSENRLHYEVFTVELLLDDDKTPRRTRSIHIQTQQEITTPGWNQTQLVNFITQNAGIGLATQPLVQPGTPLPISTPSITAFDTSELSNPIQLPMEIIAPDHESSTRLLQSDSPFSIRFALNSSDAQLSPQTDYTYQVTVYAKRLGENDHQILGETQGMLTSSEKATIRMDGCTLRQGTYHIEAVATLTSKADTEKKPGGSAILEGGIIQVY